MAFSGISPARLAAAYRYLPFQVPVSGFNVTVPLVGTDPNRVLLTITPPSTDKWFVWPGSAGNRESCWVVRDTDQTLQLTFHDLGPLIGLPWYFLTQVGGGNCCGWTESYDPSAVTDEPPPVYARPNDQVKTLTTEQERQRMESAAYKRRTLRDMINQSKRR